MRCCSGVHAWQIDPAVTTSHRLRPVLCSEYVAALEEKVRQLSADKDLPEKLLGTCATVWREEVKIATGGWDCAAQGHLPILDGSCMQCGEATDAGA